jgi:hypothetical protein
MSDTNVTCKFTVLFCTWQTVTLYCTCIISGTSTMAYKAIIATCPLICMWNLKFTLVISHLYNLNGWNVVTCFLTHYRNTEWRKYTSVLRAAKTECVPDDQQAKQSSAMIHYLLPNIFFKWTLILETFALRTRLQPPHVVSGKVWHVFVDVLKNQASTFDRLPLVVIRRALINSFELK